jgi:frataxin
MLISAFRQTARRSFVLSVASFSGRCIHSMNYARLTLPFITQRHQRWYATPPPQVKERSVKKCQLQQISVLKCSTLSSNLPMEQYHTFSDSTMDSLLESLESLLDEMNSNYEVEYHVRP